MGETRERTVTVGDGIELVVTEAGLAGDPVVVLCHGFPECAYSWRHQMQPLADAGFHVLAPDQRGYGHSSAPDRVDAYDAASLTADMVGLLDSVGADQAVFVGHDWGAMVVWHMAQLHPDRVRAVVGASVPYPATNAPPLEILRAIWNDNFFYILYFQEVGIAEAELEGDLRGFLRAMAWSASGEGFHPSRTRLPAEGTTFVQSLLHDANPMPTELPYWLSDADLDVYVERFEASGLFGPLGWYRNLDVNYEQVKDIPHDTVSMPSYFIGGTNDPVIVSRKDYEKSMRTLLPGYRGSTMVDGSGHWTQQEHPAEFNAALLGFLRTL